MYTIGGERGVRVIVSCKESNKNRYPVGTKSFDLFKTKVFNSLEHFGALCEVTSSISVQNI